MTWSLLDGAQAKETKTKLVSGTDDFLFPIDLDVKHLVQIKEFQKINEFDGFMSNSMPHFCGFFGALLPQSRACGSSDGI